MPDDQPRPPRDLNDRLGRALAGPVPEAEFRGSLRARLVAEHPSTRAERDTAASPADGRDATRRVDSARRNRTRPTVVLLVAALAIALGVMGYRTYFLTPIAEFGTLPLPGAGLPVSLSGAGGPGFTFDYSYHLSSTLKQGWPALAKQADAYAVAAPRFTEAWVGSVATRLGITAPPVREGWQDGYLLAADPGDGGPSLRMYPGGYVTYSAPYDFGPAERTALPTAARAIATARTWLTMTGIVPEGQLNAGRVTEDLAIGLLIVEFRPVVPANVVSLAPWASVQIGRGEKVVVGSATWFPVTGSSPYPLRGVADAWQDVIGGHGTISWQVREWPGPSDDSGVVHGEVGVQAVEVAWCLALAADGKTYLVPCYAFTGEVEVQGQSGPERYPVKVWAAAVQDRYSGK